MELSPRNLVSRSGSRGIVGDCGKDDVLYELFLHSLPRSLLMSWFSYNMDTTPASIHTLPGYAPSSLSAASRRHSTQRRIFLPSCYTHSELWFYNRQKGSHTLYHK